jgi:hypothetical protein
VDLGFKYDKKAASRRHFYSKIVGVDDYQNGVAVAF